VFTIAEIAMKHTAAVTPINLVARPQRSVEYQRRYRCTFAAPLARLPGLAGWQSLSAGHVYLKSKPGLQSHQNSGGRVENFGHLL
jgi:hypothetical protein